MCTLKPDQAHTVFVPFVCLRALWPQTHLWFFKSTLHSNRTVSFAFASSRTLHMKVTFDSRSPSAKNRRRQINRPFCFARVGIKKKKSLTVLFLFFFPCVWFVYVKYLTGEILINERNEARVVFRDKETQRTRSRRFSSCHGKRPQPSVRHTFDSTGTKTEWSNGKSGVHRVHQISFKLPQLFFSQ